LYNGILDGGAYVVQVLGYKVGIFFGFPLYKIEDTGLQSAKTKVEALYLGPWKGKCVRVPQFCVTVDQGAARIGQSQDLGAFVEGLSHGIVQGFPQYFHIKV